MLFLDVAQLPDGPLMAVDPGAKTLGLAVCDAARTTVTPLTTIQRIKFTQDAAELFKLFDERDCKALIIGLPVHMDGGDGRRAQSARALATNLLRLRDIAIAYQDERLSTFAAEERLREAGVRPQDVKRHVDAQAAAIILESALKRIADARRVPEGGAPEDRPS